MTEVVKAVLTSDPSTVGHLSGIATFPVRGEKPVIVDLPTVDENGVETARLRVGGIGTIIKRGDDGIWRGVADVEGFPFLAELQFVNQSWTAAFRTVRV